MVFCFFIWLPAGGSSSTNNCSNCYSHYRIISPRAFPLLGKHIRRLCPSPHPQLARDPFQRHRRLRPQPLRNAHFLYVAFSPRLQVLRRPPEPLQFRRHDPARLLLSAPLPLLRAVVFATSLPASMGFTWVWTLSSARITWPSISRWAAPGRGPDWVSF